MPRPHRVPLDLRWDMQVRHRRAGSRRVCSLTTPTNTSNTRPKFRCTSFTSQHTYTPLLPPNSSLRFLHLCWITRGAISTWPCRLPHIPLLIRWESPWPNMMTVPKYLGITLRLTMLPRLVRVDRRRRTASLDGQVRFRTSPGDRVISNLISPPLLLSPSSPNPLAEQFTVLCNCARFLGFFVWVLRGLAFCLPW
jgi:hypothetical protein